MDQRMKAPYALLGTGELVIEKAAELYGRASSFGRQARRTDMSDVYEGLAHRGEALVKRIQRSKTAKRAVEGTRQATRQFKGAVTSLRKAVGMEEQKQTSSRKAS
jgi:multidrug efflux pump subunit AcrA (membrane-fusion protein)